MVTATLAKEIAANHVSRRLAEGSESESSPGPRASIRWVGAAEQRTQRNRERDNESRTLHEARVRGSSDRRSFAANHRDVWDLGKSSRLPAHLARRRDPIFRDGWEEVYAVKAERNEESEAFLAQADDSGAEVEGMPRAQTVTRSGRV